jgi:hypothetical protein
MMSKKFLKAGDFTASEAMIIYGSRMLAPFNGKVGIIGIGAPLLATHLAKLLHCPDMKMIVETGQARQSPGGPDFHYGQSFDLRVIMADGGS